MWDTFKIGTGECGCSAITCVEDVSQNSVSYWCVEPITKIGFRVMKDTDEGAWLKMLIKESKEEELKYYLLELVMRNITPNKMKDIIDGIKKKSFEKGKHNKQKEIRLALGI
jgi:hypothetical protein